jgi:hypothetical protein
MFFKECARLAEQHPDLASVFEKLDSQLGAMRTAEVIRSDDLASFLTIEPNQMRSALEMFSQVGVLDRVEMIECTYCEMAALRSDYQEALIEDDEYRCTSCDRPLTGRTIQIITAYRRGEKWQEVSNPSDGSGDADLCDASSSSASIVTLDEQAWSTEKACVFHRGTKVWTLSFDGTTAHVADLAGMNYIAELLRHPRTPINADTLVATIRENTDTPVETAEERVVGAGAAMPGIPLTDAKAIKTVKAELAKRKAELKDSSAEDETTTAKLEREISQLQDYLAQVKGHHGRPRTTGGIASRARSRVKHAIDRAITRITEQHLPLANHLQNSIRTGNSLVYTPTVVPNWQF